MSPTKLATFAAGCFWGVEEAFRRSGLCLSTTVGYTGGSSTNPSYRKVCTGTTGHAEACQVSYDPTRTSYPQLLALFWRIHDPTQVDRQGPDHGTQYRSAIFCHDEEQQREAEASKAEQQRERGDGKAIATEIAMAGVFWPAEDYHQQYIAKGGASGCHF
jgi:peptide-methionine (S)-S-oxide reductase